ncbi:glycosyltransferase family 2 protein [Paracnuella aquatica]|uniref:glycosyltransferase family 2 protein n=1 Tax=Paracnuella aquatica TaxID=2268757 RepID=UPI000DEEECC8|nr:glycosyltransferase family 2 protein [Paracnuella aquatica]RPD45528.1 glycosyltransferase family 2 protein [Paracnuella aquatica]
MVKLSVVIPTYNRGGKILTTLKSLANQTFQDFEVVVINDGSTDNTKEVLDAIDTSSYPYKITMQHQENMGRAGSRNSGFNRVASELIVSVDDDMRLDPYCIEAHYLHHQQHPGTILVGVQQEDPKLARNEIQKFIAHQRVGWLKDLERTENPMRPDQIYITAANFSISKATFNKIGGFDPRLKAVVDYDLAMRASEMGIPIFYSKNAIGWHEDFVTCRSYINRKRQGVANGKKLKELKPDLVGKYHRYKEFELSAKQKLKYQFFANSFFVWTIDKANVYKYILPKKVRYALYGTVVMALGKYFPHKKF